MSDLLDDVFRRHAGAGPDPAERARIRDERAAVMGFLDAGGTAYGFTSRVGHLDGERADALAPDAFLADHLWGPVFPLDASVLRLLSAVKGAQLARGGSGVSEEAHMALAAHAAARDGAAGSGAWTSSYGAGDVVPGAWWLKDVMAHTGLTLRQGDFIACVNGHFVSTTYAILLLDAWADVVARYLALLPALPSLGASSPRADSILLLLSMRPPATGVQAAISVRDVRPFVAAVEAGGDQLRDAITTRLGQPSGNPLFVFDEGGRAEPVSQNSYLDFGVTFAATTVGSAALVALAHCQRLIDVHAAATGEPALVQAPKVAQAVLEAVSDGPPQRFSSVQSAGVEDMYDASLLSVLAAMRKVVAWEEALSIAERAGVAGPAASSPVEIRDDVRRRFGVQGVRDRGIGIAACRALLSP